LELQESRNHRKKLGRREKMKLIIREEIKSRGGCCEIPGCTWSATLEWHHRDPSTKRFSIGDLANGCGGKSTGQLRDELAKCELLCPNHHSLLTKENHGN
jgi:hypothetical protein